MTREAVLLSFARTPMTRLNGALSSLTAASLGAAAIRAALARSGATVDDVDAVLMGQVVLAGAGQNPARQAAHLAGLPWTVPATTVNKVCLSGLTAIVDAARLISCEEADVVVAGGQESMSQAPHLLPGSRRGWTYGDLTAVDSLAWDGLTDAFDHESMGASTERGNARLGLTREAQDAVAVASHTRAAAAVGSGVFAEEIVPVPVPQRRGDDVLVEADEGIRPGTTLESLAALRPAFTSDGTITAGNASPLTDGAAAVVVAARDVAEARGWPWLCRVVAWGQVAGPDTSLHSQPSAALSAALKHAGWDTGTLDLVEINEAFGSVVAQSLADLAYPLERTNIHGGAIALGHPIGASGARLAGHAALELARRGSGRAGVALCGGGGQGEAMLLER
ncbi:acetyl-CoA C-acetyltransferase [Cellulomonas fimi]|uniref:Probable acetyl-CoA acetyltransferase n=1 Tax=Cellulomonas fimi (strain ATCC 484 / DSM 20113 / JCM 1341 / CCUG 24087 / LMG 16345 / NBRC 15513 / NCIMB 8980 / NCTC 7547 / NRS-133) TaxID=590998 RepID=F4H585_CELFA|nr:acetyl-CoA C-acetyltransferase [Cellulomonas fimi]AEE46691.1 acetyl-CoA acetyltransferase [Cellulomonas fimi ATCC 484]NNH07664.1 acetyl-CoA C-acetyltransferase [Cellulomonas fimi]VEH33897.1 Probable acetyl-CoA acetyltransferase [Cellulomonas fimi]